MYTLITSATVALALGLALNALPAWVIRHHVGHDHRRRQLGRLGAVRPLSHVLARPVVARERTRGLVLPQGVAVALEAVPLLPVVVLLRPLDDRLPYSA